MHLVVRKNQYIHDKFTSYLCFICGNWNGNLCGQRKKNSKCGDSTLE
ncbi:hypothetical protein N499_0762 [Wolbachia pipientis wVitA]|nr:hypothetical protein N499_0762 [Wolbachia pipientis wVitA]